MYRIGIKLLTLSTGSEVPPQARSIKVTTARTGAASAKIIKCFLIRCLSRPSCNKKVTRPNAAGALCNIMAKNTMNSMSI